MKILLKLALLLFLYSINTFTFGQPYHYYTSKEGTYLNIYREDLQNGDNSLFITNVDTNAYIKNDDSQEWIYIIDKNYLEVINCFDTTSRHLLLDDLMDLENVFYNSKNNCFLVSWQKWDDTNTNTAIFSADTFSLIDTLPNLLYLDYTFFFSADGDTVFSTVVDSTDQSRNLIGFSLITHSIILNKPLENIGDPTPNKLIEDGKNGKLLIGYNYPGTGNQDNKYVTYDPHSETISSPMPFPYRSKGYLTPDSKYAVIEEVDLDTTKPSREFRPGKVIIFDALSGSKLKELQLPQEGILIFFENIPDIIYYYLPDNNEIFKEDLSVYSKPEDSGLIVKLLNSYGTRLTGGQLKYYEGGWKDAVNNNDGTFTVDTKLAKVSLRMKYEYGSQTISNVAGGPDTVIFKTVNALVKLQNSTGDNISEGTVQYYAGGWRDFGETENGTASKELLPGNYSFRMKYAYSSNDKQQNIGDDPEVLFQTVNANVQLKNSQGDFIDQGTVQYYAGGWRDFGVTADGTAAKELLPGNYSFRMKYAYSSIDKQQNIGTDPTVIFQTVNANVQLKDSRDNFMDEGTVQYYAGGWRDFGVTADGTASKELLPNNYSFRMKYAYSSIDKQQNIGTDPTVIYQTVNSNVQLKDSQGNLIDEGTVQYYAGGWRDFGVTAGGSATKELLPINYSFRMKYAYSSNDKQQNIGDNPVVVFQTVNTIVQLKNSLGNFIDQGTVQYYAGGWRSLGTTSNGIAEIELLPNNYSFRMTYEYVSKDISQNTGNNNIIIFSTVLCTVKVNNVLGQPISGADTRYYAGGWREIGLTGSNGEIAKELLPSNLTFRAIYNSAQQDKSQNTGTDNTVTFNFANGQ